jgi:ELWxxDGT repeat protein
LYPAACGTISQGKAVVNGAFFVGMRGAQASSWQVPGSGNGAWAISPTAAIQLFPTSKEDNVGPDNFTSLPDGTVYFTASNAEVGNELWVTQGTVASTKLVGDIRKGRGGSEISLLTPFNRTVYFVANDGVTGAELWRVGSSGKAELFKDFNTTQSRGSSFTSMLAFGPLLLLTAHDGVSQKLWGTTGFASQVAVLKDLGSQYANPTGLVALGNRIFFTSDFGNASALWSSDGTAAGTKVAHTFPYKIYKPAGRLGNEALAFQYFFGPPSSSHPQVVVVDAGGKVDELGYGYYPKIVNNYLFLQSPFGVWSGRKKEGGYFMYSAAKGLSLITTVTAPASSSLIADDAVVAGACSIVLKSKSYHYYFSMRDPACPPLPPVLPKKISTPIPKEVPVSAVGNPLQGVRE